jgi:D-alanyl-D-alanine carboxypeptidase
VIALSGYVLGDPERSVAFSFLANGITGKQAEARDLADRIVTLLAEYATTNRARH